MPAFNQGMTQNSRPGPVHSLRSRKRNKTEHTPEAGFSGGPALGMPMPIQNPFIMDLNHTFQRGSLEAIRLGGYELGDAHLYPPAGLSPADEQILHGLLVHELHHHENNLPILPISAIPPLPPKPRAQPWHKFPEGLDDKERGAIEDKNNRIAELNQRVERERNNMAAKKSRQVRIEALANSRVLLNLQAAEIAWLRMKLVILGHSPNEWDAVPTAVKEGMVEEIKHRVEAVESRNAEVKKRQESQFRAEKNRKRKMEDGQAMDQSLSPVETEMDEVQTSSTSGQSEDAFWGLDEA